MLCVPTTENNFVFAKLLEFFMYKKTFATVSANKQRMTLLGTLLLSEKIESLSLSVNAERDSLYTMLVICKSKFCIKSVKIQVILTI